MSPSLLLAAPLLHLSCCAAVAAAAPLCCCLTFEGPAPCSLAFMWVCNGLVGVAGSFHAKLGALNHTISLAASLHLFPCM